MKTTEITHAALSYLHDKGGKHTKAEQEAYEAGVRFGLDESKGYMYKAIFNLVTFAPIIVLVIILIVKVK